jgi:AraC-like DNA-binding protein
MIQLDASHFAAMNVFDVSDPKELGANSSVTRRFPRELAVHRYRLRELSLLSEHFDAPISRMATRTIGDLTISYVQERFGMEADIQGDGLDRFCFNTMLSGRMAFISNKPEVVAADRLGLVYRGLPGTQFITSDDNSRLNLWLDAAKLEFALASRLDDDLRRSLQFCQTIHWDVGIAASLQAQLGFLVRELGRPDGVASNPVALASYSDMVTQLVLSGIPHNYSEQLTRRRAGAVPTTIYRADEFMRAHAPTPLRLAEIASAAGCSVRALSQAYRDFRGTTPLAALHAIRLDHVRAELRLTHGQHSTAAIARRYGFTNPARFAAAYQRRFGENPAHTARFARRSDLLDSGDGSCAA